jgi:hypothetical protein
MAVFTHVQSERQSERLLLPQPLFQELMQAHGPLAPSDSTCWIQFCMQVAAAKPSSCGCAADTGCQLGAVPAARPGFWIAMSAHNVHVLPMYSSFLV